MELYCSSPPIYFENAPRVAEMLEQFLKVKQKKRKGGCNVHRRYIKACYPDWNAKGCTVFSVEEQKIKTTGDKSELAMEVTEIKRR